MATERKLLDSDCESCKSRRGKATTSAAKAALAYAKKVQAGEDGASTSYE